MTREEFIEQYYCTDVPEWYQTFKDNLDSVIENEIGKCIPLSKKKQIEEVTTHLINGLSIDGAHHKQYDLEQALIALRGQEWVDKKKVDLAKEDYYWDEGIPS